MKAILCYGDSNTWGFTPKTGARYPYSVRWPGVMAGLLGPGYHVIEDGINGRMTLMDDETKPWRSGGKGLKYALNAHKPLDLVILMLGTNDLNIGGADEAAAGAAELVRRLKDADASYGYPEAVTRLFRDERRILLVSPIHAGVEGTEDVLSRESRRFAALYGAVAKEAGVYFLDAAKFAGPCPDEGSHMLPEGHAALGRAMAEKVREIFSGEAPAL